ncbi:MAG: aromatic-ring-hydroxylating dioxygenase subunit beta [Candidatus Binatus sp.]|uniref:aromatic-ring-hydroxylating dioxygenase subunit beta n=1 Tax=Candidatus Binatus sp. TaxID=2811406 RepID=UPI00271F6B5A|nr:aromatic-ring-hydroxylating dioxygenase subunit beta [Candidatus Binatus sp.]MDO8431661.1 aromatic-ring-hydroxylating dioxygenase subunit beta [Candidatus Binatus sp.]
MPTLSRSQAEDILYQEASLLDDRRYSEWTSMLTEDAIYWIPCNGDGGDPKQTISLVYDDVPKLRDRIARLASGIAHAQSPPSITKRLISNVQIEDSAESIAAVCSAFIMYELRRGRERVFAGRYEHRMRFEDGRWKIAAKKAVLANNDEVIDNLTFIV